ncbi:RNase H family protein [Vibrio harveyi]|uniref:RNase H family protein n=1 Tax=Vibrio harveyi TaxID=669 RepID=UPI003BB5F715
MNESQSIYVSIAMNPNRNSDAQGSIGLSVYNARGVLVDESRIRFLEVESNTELELSALVEALSYAQDGDEVFISSAFCERGYNEWLDRWKAKGWRKTDRKPVVYRQLWQQVDNLRSEKYVEVYLEKQRDMGQKMQKASALAKSCFTEDEAFC